MKDNNNVAHAKVKIENSEYTPEKFLRKIWGSGNVYLNPRGGYVQSKFWL